MNRVLLILLLCIGGLSSCKKGFDAAEEVRIQAGIDDKIVQDYIAATPGLSQTARRIDTTGVYYVVLAPGQGNALFTNSTRITVAYTSKVLTTGKVFAQSNNFNPSYTLGEVIRAWQLGIPQIKKGGKVRILAPSRYAYGPFFQPELNLPANSVVDFEIELLDVTN